MSKEVPKERERRDYCTQVNFVLCFSHRFSKQQGDEEKTVISASGPQHMT